MRLANNVKHVCLLCPVVSNFGIEIIVFGLYRSKGTGKHALMRRLRITLAFVTTTSIWSATEIINDIVAIVGDQAITRVDIDVEKTRLQRRRNIKRDRRPIESQVLDLLISRALVDIAAKEESVTVTKERIENHIKKEVERQGLRNVEQFCRRVKAEIKISCKEYRRDLKRQLKTQQVMQLRVAATPPTPAQIEQFYRINRTKLGKKYKYWVLSIPYKVGNTQDEIRVNKLINQARSMAMKNFAAAARRYSRHPSRHRGGYEGWRRIDEIAKESKQLAGLVNMTAAGRLSPVVAITEKRSYYFVKVGATAAIKLDEVYEQIKNILFMESQESAFQKWIQNERRRRSIRIFLKNYREISDS